MTITNANWNQNNQIHNRKLYKQKRNLAVVHNGYSRTRTYDTSVNSRSLCQLSYTPVGCRLTSFYPIRTRVLTLNIDCWIYFCLLFWQICGYLRFGTICDVKPVCTPRTDLSCAACILTSQNRVQGSNPLVPTDHGIKTPPDKKGEKSGGVPNVWKDCFRTIYNRSRIIIA